MENEMINDILNNLESLKYPKKIEDDELFINNLNSPTQLRTDTIEWLFHQMEPQVLGTIQNEGLEQITQLQLYFKIFGLTETKDNICGMSTEINNIKCLQNLTNFVVKYLRIKNNKPLINEETNQSISLINFALKNKVELFKENIRIFLPEIGANVNESSKDVNIKGIKENIADTKKLIEKLDQKLNKLSTLNLEYEYTGREGATELKENLIKFDKGISLFLKDFNGLYEKELKYIPEDKMGKLHINCEEFTKCYSKLEEIASILEEIFSFHNKIIEYKFST